MLVMALVVGFALFAVDVRDFANRTTRKRHHVR